MRTIDQETLTYLSRATTEANTLVLTSQLDRVAYTRVAKVIEAAGGKWNRRAAAFLFDGDAATAIDPVLMTGQVLDRRREFDQFDTPPAVVDLLMAAANIRAGMKVLEPSAGTGNLVAAALAVGATVTAVEVDRGRVGGLLDRFAGARAIDTVGAEPCVWVREPMDFLALEPGGKPLMRDFDRVLMNPPFSRQQDLDHVRHAFDFLKPGGRLVAVMSAGVTFRENGKTTRFRDWLLNGRGSGGWVDLPPGSFREAGTDVRAVAVYRNRPPE